MTAASGRSANLAAGVPVVASLLVLVSSACCIGPLVVLFSWVGLTGGTMLTIESVVGPYRPLVLGLTVGFLATGFYFAYRREETGCAEGRVCARAGSRRLQRVLLWVASLFFVVLLYFTYVHPNLDHWLGIY